MRCVSNSLNVRYIHGVLKYVFARLPLIRSISLMLIELD